MCEMTAENRENKMTYEKNSTKTDPCEFYTREFGYLVSSILNRKSDIERERER